eukprot:1161695-Pelagomonas_calceolata.AAC.9
MGDSTSTPASSMEPRPIIRASNQCKRPHRKEIAHSHGYKELCDTSLHRSLSLKACASSKEARLQARFASAKLPPQAGSKTHHGFSGLGAQRVRGASRTCRGDNV